jgi:hypothetical protein
MNALAKRIATTTIENPKVPESAIKTKLSRRQSLDSADEQRKNLENKSILLEWLT